MFSVEPSFSMERFWHKNIHDMKNKSFDILMTPITFKNINYEQHTNIEKSIKSLSE